MPSGHTHQKSNLTTLSTPFYEARKRAKFIEHAKHVMHASTPFSRLSSTEKDKQNLYRVFLKVICIINEEAWEVSLMHLRNLELFPKNVNTCQLLLFCYDVFVKVCFIKMHELVKINTHDLLLSIFYELYADNNGKLRCQKLQITWF